eukprot:5288612-Amphidinium_carterae.1
MGAALVKAVACLQETSSDDDIPSFDGARAQCWPALMMPHCSLDLTPLRSCLASKSALSQRREFCIPIPFK